MQESLPKSNVDGILYDAEVVHIFLLMRRLAVSLVILVELLQI